jgi:hypothetical protein
VAAGAFCLCHGSTPGSINDTVYLERMYRAGAKGSFDAFGLHPYPPLPHDPLSGKIGWNALLQTSLEHDTMSLYGDGDKKIWGTEYGAPTGTDAKSVSEATQAQYIVEGLNYWNGLDFTGPMFIHTIRDATTTGSDWSAYLGLTHADFSPKPALDAMRNLLSG